MANEKKSTSKRGFPLKRFTLFFLFFTGLGIGGIFLSTGNIQETLTLVVNVLTNPLSLGAILLFLLLDWYSDYLRYYVLAKHFQIEMPLRFGIKVVFANLFFSYLTPGGTFGAPMVIYMLRKRGVKLSHAIALAIIKPFMLFFVLMVSGVFTYFFVDLAMTPKTQKLLAVSVGFMLVLLLLLILVVFFPTLASQLTSDFFVWLRGHLERRNPGQDTPRLNRFEHHVEETILAFSMFGRSGWKGILAAVFTTCLNLFFYICLSVAIMISLGIKSKGGLWDLWIFSYFYYFMIAFAPTPGGSGIAEGGGFLFFQGLASKHLISGYILLWRFFTCYLVMFLGAVLFLRFMQKSELDQLDELRDAHIETGDLTSHATNETFDGSEETEKQHFAKESEHQETAEGSFLEKHQLHSTPPS